MLSEQNTPKLKLENIWVIFSNFPTLCVLQKDISRIINICTVASIWRENMSKYVKGQIFLNAYSFPQATLARKFSFFGTDYVGGQISTLIIHQIFSLARDWSKRVTWPNIPQLKLGNIREYSPILKIARVAKKIWRIIKTIASIWGKNMLGYLSLNIICSS